VARAHDHGLGSESARSYLLTVLGELVLPAGGPVWTTALLEALGTLGIDSRAARQAVNRASAKGLLAAERVGRRTRWRLTKPAEDLLVEGTERIYALHHRRRSWDGRWVLALVPSPPGRNARRHLRTQLSWAGFGQLAPGAWISPWAERLHEAERALSDLGLRQAATVLVGELSHTEDPQRLVATAWDVDGLAAAYRRFLAEHEGRLADSPPPEPGEAVAELLRLVHRWRRLPFDDPDLPSELLPPGWPGEAAAACFHDLHDRLAPTAWAWWAERNEP
jgi:phenylacetic acid degradation operon negative regulatory protein